MPAKLLYPTERRIYHPELTACPYCGTPPQLLNYLASDKIVQTLTTTLALASRPSHCPDPACPGWAAHWRSIAAQQIALPGCTYGLDVVARLGRLRQTHCLTFAQVHAALFPTVQIAPATVRVLYHEAYLPLLAVTTRQHTAALTRCAQQNGGLLLALDGLAPEGGEPQLWCVYDLLSGLLLRAGWLSQFDQASFETFLAPLAATWPIRAVLSDKQRGLEDAIASVFPTAAHQLCQAHYVARLADPLAEADAQLTRTVRKAVRAGLGPALRTESPDGTAPNGVLTVTGLLPDAVPPPALPASAPPPSPAARAAGLGEDLYRRVRYLLTLTPHAPDRWAGLDLIDGLTAVCRLTHELRAHRTDTALARLEEVLTGILAAVQEEVARLRHGIGWLTNIRTLLDPARRPVWSGAEVAADLSAYLLRIAHETGTDEVLICWQAHLRGVSKHYWHGLFHTYDQAGLPRTNNDLESRFREVRRRVVRTTGQAGATVRHLQRRGAWELIAGAGSETEQGAAFSQVAPGDWEQERARMRQHQARFRVHQRNPQRAGQQLERLRQAWLALPTEDTG